MLWLLILIYHNFPAFQMIKWVQDLALFNVDVIIKIIWKEVWIFLEIIDDNAY